MRVFKFVLAFLALLAPVVVRLATTQTKTVGGQVWHNPLPNGSYFYVLLAAFWAATISFYTPCFAYEKQDDDAETAELAAPEQVPEPVPVTSARGFELDTSSFYAKKKLSVDASSVGSTDRAECCGARWTICGARWTIVINSACRTTTVQRLRAVTRRLRSCHHCPRLQYHCPRLQA